MNRFSKICKALASAPHRLFFLGGVLQAIAAMLWWLVELSGRFASVHPSTSWMILPVGAHAYLMIYGFVPFFIFGFLFTFFPNWLDTSRIPALHYLLSFFGMGAGTVLFYGGLLFSKSILLFAVLSVLLGWGIGTASLIRILLPARSSEKIHLGLMVLFILFGAAGLVSFFLWIFINDPIWLNLAEVIGIWFFLLPLTVTVSHLVIPFFSNNALNDYRVVQPLSILWILLAGIFLRGLLEGVGMRRYFWIPDTVLLIFASSLSLVWGIWKSVNIKMLFMLHLSFAWFSVAIMLDLLQNLMSIWSHENLFTLGFAPLHALTVGFLSSMVVGMSTRITLGHSGRRMAAGSAVWRIFLTLQIAAILRVVADLFLADSLFNLGGYLGAGLLWIGGFIFWLLIYGPLLWYPAHSERQ
ncbi:MAG: NnrS family protein [Nitrospirae bacterium]|nr:NnrS family protein [Candidatus Manganitrophaceae bacterium]